MTDRTNKRVHVEGLLKRKIVEETSHSDSQFIKGSKGSSSFAQPATPKSTRKKIRQDSRNDLFTIPNQLKSVFYQEHSSQQISLNSKPSKTFNSSLPPSFSNYASMEQSPNNSFQFSNPNNVQYSEDDIFRPSTLTQPIINNSSNGPFTPKRSFNSPPRNSIPPSSSNGIFFNSATSFDTEHNYYQQMNSFTPIRQQGSNNRQQPMTFSHTVGSFEFEEKSNQEAQSTDEDSTKFNLFRQQQPREEVDLFSPLHSQRFLSREMPPSKDTFSTLFSQFQ